MYLTETGLFVAIAVLSSQTLSAVVGSDGATPTVIASHPDGTTELSSSSIEESTFSLKLEERGVIRKGEPGKAAIVLRAKSPYHVNKEYPHRFKVTSAKGLTPSSGTIRSDPASVREEALEVFVPVTLSEKGPFELNGEFGFSLCTADRCLMEKRPLSISLEQK